MGATLVMVESIVEELETSIGQLARDLPGRLGVVIHFPGVERKIRLNAHEQFKAASTIKVVIMAEAYRQAESGELRLEEEIVLETTDMTGGSGVLQYLHPGLRLQVVDAVELMISLSDNTATNMVLRRVGVVAVNDLATALGLRNTVLAGLFGTARPVELRDRASETTPEDMAVLMTAIAGADCISPRASAAMARHLERVIHLDVLPRYLPLTSHAEGVDGSAMAIRIAHKSGSLTGIRHDVAILTIDTGVGERQAIISAFTDGLEDGDLWTPENVGERALGTLGKLVFDALVQLNGRER